MFGLFVDKVILSEMNDLLIDLILNIEDFTEIFTQIAPLFVLYVNIAKNYLLELYYCLI